MHQVNYHAAARSAKTEMAVLSGPTRTFSGWALVKTSKLLRPARRFVIIHAASLLICSTDNPRSALLTLPIHRGLMHIDRNNRLECSIRLSTYRIWMQWATEADLRVCKQAFEFANREVSNYYKLVTHRQLGKGRASEVVFAFDVSTGDHAAVKVMNKDRARTSDREFAEKEVNIRMTIQHPCIVQTIDIFESPYDLFVVMELMGGGPLDRRLAKQGAGLGEGEARMIMRRLFGALSHLHSRGIAHRNVKPQNIFLDISDGVKWCETAKLSDFSLACFLEDPESSRQVVGTPEYLAPEATVMTRIADGERAVVFGTEVDMWAAGVTLYNMLSRELPFEGEYPPDVFKKARSGKVRFPQEGFGGVSREAISLIRSLLNVDRRKRPTAEVVLLHDWFQEGGMEEEELVGEVGMLSLTGRLGGAVTEGLYRFRVAIMAVRVVLRLVRWTPGVRLRVSRVEKRFQFNVSGIDIAPKKDGAFAEVEEGKKAGGMVQRHSTTVMSRISTGSTVKSRSSWGESVGSPPAAGRMEREGEYIGRGGLGGGSFGSSSMNSVQRLMTETVGIAGEGGSWGEGVGRWRWRKRGSAKEGRPPLY